MARHVCKMRHCIHVYAGSGPVNVMNTTDAEIPFYIVITIAKDEL